MWYEIGWKWWVFIVVVVRLNEVWFVVVGIWIICYRFVVKFVGKYVVFIVDLKS